MAQPSDGKQPNLQKVDGQADERLRTESATKADGGRRFQRVGAYGFLGLAVLPTMLVLLLVYHYVEASLRDIQSASVKASKVHLPGILNTQRTLINIENLRRYVETMYTAFAPEVRREAMINALGLATESVFEPDSRFGSNSMSSIALIRNLGEVKLRSEEARLELHDAEARFSASLARLGMLLAADSAVVQQQARHTKALTDWIRLWPNAWVRSDALRVLEPVFGYCGKLLDDPARVGGALVEGPQLECAQLRSGWREMGEAQRAQVQADIEARRLWLQLDDTLRKLSDLASSEEAELTYLAMEHIHEEAGRTYISFYVSCALLLLILCVFGLLLHRYILSPLALVSRSLQRIRDGRTVEALPLVRVQELQEMLDIIPVLSSHVNELSARSDLLEQEKDKFRSLSLVDGLTGVGNRRCFDACLADVEAGRSVALLMIDVDLFKAYNDTYGHQAGDAVLITIAQAMRTAMHRATDQVFRYGGEEFCVLLPDAVADAALKVAERLREQVLELAIPHSGSSVASFVTVSIGVALRVPGETSEELIKEADRALYEAKKQGRNQVRFGRLGSDIANA